MTDSIGRQLFCKLFKPDGLLLGKEIGMRLATTPQRVGNWKQGNAKPDQRARELICAHWPNIRVETWDQAPLVVVQPDELEPDPATPFDSPLPAATLAGIPLPTYQEVTSKPPPRPKQAEVLGPEGIEQLISKLVELQAEPNATPTDKMKALGEERQARVQLANLRAKEQSDREKYLQSPQAALDVAEVYRLLGPDFQDRMRLVFGPAANTTLPPTEEPDALPISIDNIRVRLVNSKELRGIGEPLLASAEIIRLQLLKNANQIAKTLSTTRATHAVEILDLLASQAPQECQVIRAALEIHNLIQDGCEALPHGDHRLPIFAKLLELTGHLDLAKDLTS